MNQLTFELQTFFVVGDFFSLLNPYDAFLLFLRRKGFEVKVF